MISTPRSGRLLASGSRDRTIYDTMWRVSGPDCPAGSRVKIARTNGADLMVETA
jgi:membrane protein implicated in regulation of membrane protease activity